MLKLALSAPVVVIVMAGIKVISTRLIKLHWQIQQVEGNGAWAKISNLSEGKYKETKRFIM